MRRFFIRPFFDFHEPFLPFQRVIRPAYRLRINPSIVERPSQYEVEDKSDPHYLFDQFFKENEIKSQEEKEFFKKHYPENVEEKFDPFKVLEISSQASAEEVKDAYRKLAIKFHPKNDSSPEAANKFAQIGKAYETILSGEKSKQINNLGFRSFFDEFDKELDEKFNPKEVKGEKEGKNDQEPKSKELNKEESKFGVLYSESSNYESVNGQQTKYIAQKLYKKDGKLLKVTREEKLKEDGNMEITETIDNGSEVKKKTFTQEKGSKKQIQN